MRRTAQIAGLSVDQFLGDQRRAAGYDAARRLLRDLGHQISVMVAAPTLAVIAAA